MQTAKLLAFLLFLVVPFSAHARVLHYGDYSVALTDEKHTTPALHIQIGDELVFGAMFTDTAPENSLRISFNDTNYWVGPWCAAGTYRLPGTRECTPCGIGHYCTGGSHRAACSGGAIACPGVNHGMDATTELANKILTADEVNQYMPATDISQWKLLSSCQEMPCSRTFVDYGVLDDISCACARGVIGPGTYLFIGDYVGQSLLSAYIAVFDHPVEYGSFHANGIFYNAIDTEHIPYQTYNVRAAPDHWLYGTNQSNVTGLYVGMGGSNIRLIVYELK